MQDYCATSAIRFQRRYLQSPDLTGEHIRCQRWLEWRCSNSISCGWCRCQSARGKSRKKPLLPALLSNNFTKQINQIMTRFKQESICLFLCKLFPELDYLCSEIKLFLSILSEPASYRSAIGVLPQCISVYSQMQAGLLDAVSPISPDLWWYCCYHNRASFLLIA